MYGLGIRGLHRKCLYVTVSLRNDIRTLFRSVHLHTSAVVSTEVLNARRELALDLPDRIGTKETNE
jgi:hypothetical protein